jgi:hypothetical protein
MDRGMVAGIDRALDEWSTRFTLRLKYRLGGSILKIAER